MNKFGYSRYWFLLAAFTVGLTIATPIAFAQRVISYQGILTNGRAPVDGPHAMTLKLYRDTNSLPIFQEMQNVTVAGGIFNVLIGKVVALPPLSFSGSNRYWLGVQVDGANELTPRAQLTDVPSAFFADTANFARSVDLTGGTSGQVFTSNGSSAPTWQDIPTPPGLPTGAIVEFADNGAHSGFTLLPSSISIGEAWATKASMPTARTFLAAAAAGNGKLYAVGGYNGGYLSTCEEYDPSSNAWTAKASMNTMRDALAAAAPGNGKLYAVGGYDGSSIVSTCEEYDPSANTWTAKASMNTARSALAAAAPGNGKLYVVGGDNGNTLSTCEEYDPSTNTWRAKASMNTARENLAAAAPGNGKLYAIGGLNGGYFSTCEEYDPSANTWATKALMPTARAHLAAAAPGNGKLYAVGGYNATNYLTACEEYDPSTDTWTAKASMRTARRDLAAAAADNGKIYAIGGYNVTYLSTCEEYTPAVVLYFFSKN